MSKVDNIVLKYLVKNYKKENFKIFTKFSFISTFIITVLFGLYFSYVDSKRCHIIGHLNLNPIFTPGQILGNENYVLRNVSKNIPGIRWGLNTNFEISGSKNKKFTYCRETLAKFEKEFDKNYQVLISNLNKATFKAEPVIEALSELDNLENMSASDIQNIIEATLLSYEKKKVISALSDVEKYTLKWEYKKKGIVNFKQLSFFIFLGFIFSIAITTLSDFIQYIRPKKS